MNRLSHIQKLQRNLQKQQADAYLVTQNIDLFYYTGSMQQGYLFIPSEGEACFYVRRSVVRAERESAVAVKELGSFRAFGETLKRDFPEVFSHETVRILTEYDVLPVQLFERLKAVIPNATWQDGSKLIREQRMIKSPEEISIMQKAANIADKALKEAIVNIKEGMSELQLIARIENKLREEGHLGVMRMRSYNQEIVTGMVASGEAAAEPTYFEGPAGGKGLSPASPQSSSTKTIRKNEPILIDIGCNIDGYVTDQTRTAVIGAMPQPLQQAYEFCEQLLRQTESMLKPGTPCEELYAMAAEEVEKAGYSAHFMGYGKDQVKFLGHGIGLEIDELPVLAKGFTYPLQTGMVIAIEPKLIFPGEGVVGIENTYVITDTGFNKLTVSPEGVWSVPLNQ